MNPLPILLGGVIAAIAAVASKKSAASSGSYELDANMPPALANQVLAAIANEKDPNKLMQLAQQMATQGYPLASVALQTRAAQLNVAPGTVPGKVTPPPMNPAIPALDPGMDPQTMAAVLQALASETDPTKLAQFAASIQSQWPTAAALLNAKARAMGYVAPMPPPGVVIPPGPMPTPYVPPAPPPPPAPAPYVAPPAPAPAPAPAPPGTIIAFTPDEIASGNSVRGQMTNDEWTQTAVMLNDWLNQNAADPKINFIDLSWFRDQPDDLMDAGNLSLAMEALDSLSIQNGTSFSDVNHMGVIDAPTLGNLYAWAQKNPGLVRSNMTILSPFSNGLLAALRKANPTNTAGVTTGWRSPYYTPRTLPARLARGGAKYRG